MPPFSPFPILQTERLDLQPFGQEDKEALYFMRTDPRVNRYTNRPRPKDLEEVAAFIRKIKNGIANNEMINWGIYLKGQSDLLGSVGYWKFNAERTGAHIGYELHPDHWGKGIMQEAYSATLEYVQGPMALQFIQAWVHPDNQSSIRFLERNDYQFIRRVPAGAEGDPTDMLVYEYLVRAS